MKLYEALGSRVIFDPAEISASSGHSDGYVRTSFVPRSPEFSLFAFLFAAFYFSLKSARVYMYLNL